MSPTTVQIIGTTLFAVAILHTFCSGVFTELAKKHPKHAGFWKLFAEVEFAFAFWAGMLIVFVALTAIGTDITPFVAVTEYLGGLKFTEPLFVLAIMIVAASKPVLLFASGVVQIVSRRLPVPRSIGFYFTVLAAIPLLSSLITEPAAMALAAMILRETYYRKGISPRLMYATIGVLFVNISIGGTLTSFAAPPVLMVASAWQWDSWFMLTHIGWRSALAVFINALLVSAIFRKELLEVKIEEPCENSRVPFSIILLHLLFLFLVVLFGHHPYVFICVLLVFLAFAYAYPRYQNRLLMHESLMVSCFLGGLVILGGQQNWWMQPLLASMGYTTAFYGTLALTPFVDNAAITYLASLVPNLTDEFKYAMMTGAIAGGGLTVIANAPNPAGMAILQGQFKNGKVHPLGLLLAALLPTFIAAVAYRMMI